MIQAYDNLIVTFRETGMETLLPEGVTAKESRRCLLPVTVSTEEDGPRTAMEGCWAVSFPKDGTEAETVFRPDGYQSSFAMGDLSVTADVTYEDGVFRQVARVKNNGSASKTLTHFSSLVLSGLDRAGSGYWFTPDKLRVHVCRYGWSREAQWCSMSVQDLGIYPGSDENAGFQSNFRFSSIGSWSTGNFYPILILEDTEVGVSYFVELLGPTNWTIELGHYGDPRKGAFYIEANDADREAGKWSKALAKGETFASTPVLFGAVQGGFEEVIHRLTAYKRKHTLSHWENGVPLICVNDYMNGLHGNLTAERCIPLIDAAAECGAEVYCMDAGWCKPTNMEDWQRNLGDWMPNEERFGEYGLQGVMDHIREKGMIPGIWVELEAFTTGSPLYQKGYYLKREDGTPLRLGNRYFPDMTNPEARAYLTAVIDRLYGMGIRYIKNDYNASTMTGPSVSGSSAGEGNRMQAAAVREFFKEIREKYPDLILENCGSGGMRADQGMLSIFTLQSITDEEGYLYIPAILAGSAAVMPPEKEGVWSYAFPENSPVYGEFGSEAYLESMKDGEKTVFGMVTGMLGCITLGGRLDCMDEPNKALVKEATDTYRACRHIVAEGYPIYPCGTVNKGNGRNTAYGLWHKASKRILLAVWRFSETEETVTADLSKYGTVKNVTVRYPADPMGASVSVSGNTVSVTLPKMNSARLLEIELA